MSVLKNATAIVPSRNHGGVQINENGRCTVTAGFQKEHKLETMHYFELFALPGKKAVALKLSKNKTPNSKSFSRTESAGMTAYAEIGADLASIKMSFEAGGVQASFDKADNCIVLTLK